MEAQFDTYGVAGSDGILTGFDVIDAVGIRIGSVADCYRDEDGKARFLRVSMAHSSGYGAFLIPAFYVTIVDPDRRKIQVRALRRLTVPQLCHPFDESVTTPALIREMAAAHPPANPDLWGL